MYFNKLINNTSISCPLQYNLYCTVIITHAIERSTRPNEFALYTCTLPDHTIIGKD